MATNCPIGSYTFKVAKNLKIPTLENERMFSKSSVYDVTNGIDIPMVSDSYTKLLIFPPSQTNSFKLKEIAKFQRNKRSPL